jgi:ubiquinone/menaquinone biosynthesis C-methylase UbiE
MMTKDTIFTELDERNDSQLLTNTFSFYDSIAPFYNALMILAALIDGVSARKERENFIKCLDLNPTGRVLELGVGTGINLPLVAQNTRNEGCIVGLDHSIPMLEQGRKRSLRKKIPAYLIAGDAERLPFKDGFFDTVYIFGSFNTIADQKRTVREMIRVAKPKGLIVISDKSLAVYKKHRLRKTIMQLLEPDLVDPPPEDAIPLPQMQIQMNWVWKNLMYVFKFRNPSS